MLFFSQTKGEEKLSATITPDVWKDGSKKCDLLISDSFRCSRPFLNLFSLYLYLHAHTRRTLALAKLQRATLQIDYCRRREKPAAVTIRTTPRMRNAEFASSRCIRKERIIVKRVHIKPVRVLVFIYRRSCVFVLLFAQLLLVIEGICAMCGRKVLDTTAYKQSST
jgi:hypothetical protein